MGEAAQIAVDQGAFSLRARVNTVAAGTQFKIGCDELDTAGVLQRDENGKAIIDVWGEIAADFHKGKTLVMKSPSPVESFIDQLGAALANAGVVVDGSIAAGIPPVQSEVLHTHKSQTLADILQTSLATSNAFDHEMFALAASAKQAGGSTSLPEAAARLDTFLQEQGGQGRMANASGIGNENRLRARDLVGLLSRAGHDARLHPLLAALATPGGVGTLKTRLLNGPAEQSFAGKTGTGEKAAALSGVVGDVVMSLLVTDTRSGREGARAALDGLAIGLASLS